MRRHPRNAAVLRLDGERVAAGVCRHCGGAVPCWSRWGDRAVGVAHTAASHRARLGSQR